MAEKKKAIRNLDIITGEPIELNELVVKLAKRMNDIGETGNPKKKMSYSISPLAQVLIKAMAQETGATQGAVVETAPLLFAKMAMDSLDRRSRAMGSLKTLSGQITRSLDAIAGLSPHLKPFTNQVKILMEEILDMENRAVQEENYQGVDPSPHKGLAGLDVSPDPAPPYHREMKQFLGENNRLGKLFDQYHR